jgi:hypothetical protein
MKLKNVFINFLIIRIKNLRKFSFKIFLKLILFYNITFLSKLTCSVELTDILFIV